MKYPITTKLRMESAIIHTINTDNVARNTVHFEYHENILGHTDLYVVTVNRITDNVFLLTHVTGEDDLDCLSKALSYVSDMYAPDHNYIVKWTDGMGEDMGIHTSYFRAKDEEEVKEKFEFDILSDRQIVSIEQTSIA